ncbi:hypothetical protein BC830DRAFT_1230132 [Chytriomyces sp. MP71]|nr:hypothetical protein BC830DRAFT_1230132 [Chytriomyces sp. MP71]
MQTQQLQQSKVCCKSSGKCLHVEAGLSSPMKGTDSQFSIPPSAESIADEWDHSNSFEDMLQFMELQMIGAQHASKAKEACFLWTLSKKNDCISSLIVQVSELSSQLTAAMQRLFQDAPGELPGCKDAGRDRQPAGPPPVPTPVAGQTCARGLQPQQSPPAAQSLHPLLQEGPYTQHEDNMTRADALPVTPVHPEPRPRPLPQPHQPMVHQQQPQLQPAPAKNKPWGKQPRMSYAAATAANKAAIANQIIEIRNENVAPQLQVSP